MKRHGSTDDPRPERYGGATKHPHWMRWTQLKRRNELVPEWTEFWAFADGVGAPTEEGARLGKHDRSKPFGPDNFRWAPKWTRDHKVAYLRARYLDNPARSRDYHYTAEYGISDDDQIEMTAEQRDLCAITDLPETRAVRVNAPELGVRRLQVDHDHQTGNVRNLLSGQVNVALGGLKDNPRFILRAAYYVAYHRAEALGLKTRADVRAYMHELLDTAITDMDAKSFFTKAIPEDA